jgi:hypothetical protein
MTQFARSRGSPRYNWGSLEGLQDIEGDDSKISRISWVRLEGPEGLQDTEGNDFRVSKTRG